MDAGAETTGSQLSDASGNASFSLKPGTYTVCEVLQASCHNSQSGSDSNPCYTLTVTSGQTPSRDFGNYRNATLTVFKYDDKAADGNYDVGTDTPLGNWRFFIDANTNEAMASDAQTHHAHLCDASGNASLSLKPA